MRVLNSPLSRLHRGHKGEDPFRTTESSPGHCNLDCTELTMVRLGCCRPSTSVTCSCLRISMRRRPVSKNDAHTHDVGYNRPFSWPRPSVLFPALVHSKASFSSPSIWKFFHPKEGVHCTFGLTAELPCTFPARRDCSHFGLMPFSLWPDSSSPR